MDTLPRKAVIHTFAGETPRTQEMLSPVHSSLYWRFQHGVPSEKIISAKPSLRFFLCIACSSLLTVFGDSEGNLGVAANKPWCVLPGLLSVCPILSYSSHVGVRRGSFLLPLRRRRSICGNTPSAADGQLDRGEMSPMCTWSWHPPQSASHFEMLALLLLGAHNHINRCFRPHLLYRHHSGRGTSCFSAGRGLIFGTHRCFWSSERKVFDSAYLVQAGHCSVRLRACALPG